MKRGQANEISRRDAHTHPAERNNKKALHEGAPFAIQLFLQFPGSTHQCFPPDLVAKTEALQERRCLGILQRRIRCSGVGHGRYLSPCILLFLPDPHAMMSLGPDLCACILYGPNLSVFFHGPNPRRGILRHPHRSSLRRAGLCPCLFLCRPSLELLEQGFGEWLASLGLALTDLGLVLTALGCLTGGLGLALASAGSTAAAISLRAGASVVVAGASCVSAIV